MPVKKSYNNRKDKDWLELCEYIHDVVLEYDSSQSLSRFMLFRLKGLKKNQYLANNYIEITADYSYTVILNTFKFCKIEIEKAKQTKSFNSEQHKFNYFCTIVESKLNDVYERMRVSEKAKEKSDSMDFSTITGNNRAEYKNKTTTKISNKFDDMW